MEFCSQPIKKGRISKTQPDYSISHLFGHERHMGFINWAKLSLLAHVARDEEDVKKKTARIPGSGFRRIKKKKKYWINWKQMSFYQRTWGRLWPGSAHVTPPCVTLRPQIWVFVCALNAKFTCVCWICWWITEFERMMSCLWSLLWPPLVSACLEAEQHKDIVS